eukprot:m.372057 g.372057  ORF g.372057 m.372057 type:complete len:69 (-) comp61847_c0_seq1:4-210(-)
MPLFEVLAVQHCQQLDCSPAYLSLAEAIKHHQDHNHVLCIATLKVSSNKLDFYCELSRVTIHYVMTQD